MSERLNQLEEIIQEQSEILETHESRINEIEEKLSESVSLEKEVSLAEFVNNQVEPTTHKEKVISICYYLEANEDFDAVNTADIEEGYQRCGLEGTNFSARASEAAKSGLLNFIDTTNPRQFVLTKTGVDQVEQLLSKE